MLVLRMKMTLLTTMSHVAWAMACRAVPACVCGSQQARASWLFSGIERESASQVQKQSSSSLSSLSSEEERRSDDVCVVAALRARAHAHVHVHVHARDCWWLAVVHRVSLNVELSHSPRVADRANVMMKLAWRVQAMKSCAVRETEKLLTMMMMMMMMMLKMMTLLMQARGCFGLARHHQIRSESLGCRGSNSWSKQIFGGWCGCRALCWSAYARLVRDCDLALDLALLIGYHPEALTRDGYGGGRGGR